MKKILILIVPLLGLSAVVFADYKDKIKQRLQPMGSICFKGDDCASGAITATGPRSAEAVYNTGCLACHTTGAGGAPKIGDADAWNLRLEKGIETLYDNAYNGINTMPAKGVCSDCTEAEIQAAVDYIINQIR